MTELPSIPVDVGYQHLVGLRIRLQNEIRGMRNRHPKTAYSTIKKEYKLTGSRENVLRKFSAYIEMVKERNYGYRHNWVPKLTGPLPTNCLCDLPYEHRLHVCLAHEDGSIETCICMKEN